MPHVHSGVSDSTQFVAFLEALHNANFLNHGNKVLDLTEKISKGHIVFINSPPENYNLSLLQEGGEGVSEQFLMSPFLLSHLG